MKRFILVLSIISALFLAGCNSNEVMDNDSLSGNKDNQIYEELTDNLEDNDAMVIIENYLNLLAMKEGSYEGLLDFLELVDKVQMDSEKTMLSSNGSEFWKTNIKYDDFKNKLLEYMSLNCFETFSEGFEEKDGYLYTLPLGATGYSYDVYEVNLEEKNNNYYVYTAKAKLNDISEIFETRNIEVTIIKENDKYVVDNKMDVYTSGNLGNQQEDTEFMPIFNAKDYEGDWKTLDDINKNLEEDVGRFLTIKAKDSNTIDIEYSVISATPFNRIALINLENIELDDNQSGKFTWEDSWYNKGKGTIKLDSDKVLINIIDTKVDENAMWGIFDDEVVFSEKVN